MNVCNIMKNKEIFHLIIKMQIIHNFKMVRVMMISYCLKTMHLLQLQNWKI